MPDETTTTRARIRQAIWPRAAPDTTAVETLTHWLEEARQERDIALAAAAHWRANAGEAERRKRHVSGLLNEALNERRDLVAELRRLLSLHLEGGTELIAGGHSEPEIAGQFSAGYVIAPAVRYQLIAALLREQP